MDEPEAARAMAEASARVEALHAELRDAYPILRGNLALDGLLLGHGLGAFVANGMPDAEILAHVRDILAHIRRTIALVAHDQELRS